MKVLVLGGDGRAHTLIWKLFNSSQVSDLICAPGNGGTGQLAPSADLDAIDIAAVARWAFDEGVDVIVPIDNHSLQAGLVDEVISFHIGVCGPPQRAAALAGSRCRAKAFMLRHNLPTAPGRAFDNRTTAEKYLATQPLPVIIKADHPSGGEAVYHDRYAALEGSARAVRSAPARGRWRRRGDRELSGRAARGAIGVHRWPHRRAAAAHAPLRSARRGRPRAACARHGRAHRLIAVRAAVGHLPAREADPPDRGGAGAGRATLLGHPGRRLCDHEQRPTPDCAAL